MGGHRVPLDVIAAMTGAVASAILAIYVGLTVGNPVYLLTALVAFGACSLWLAKAKDLKSTIAGVESPRVVLALICAFTFLLSASIWSVYMRADTYVRPLAYFVLTSFMAATVGSEILFRPSGDNRYLVAILLQITVIGLSLNWTQQLIFPSVTGIDPAYYRLFTLNLVGSGRIPEGSLYSSFAITQVTTAAVMLAINASYEVAAVQSIGLIQILEGSFL